MKIKVLLALGGAVAALAGGALLFNYIASQSEKKYGLFDVELKEIGKIKREANSNFIDLQQMAKIYSLILKYGKDAKKDEMKKLVEERRGHLKESKGKAYVTVAVKCAKMEEEIYDDLCNHALKQLGVNRQEYEQSHQFFQSHPSFQMLELERETEHLKTVVRPAEFDREKALEVFSFIDDLQKGKNEHLLNTIKEGIDVLSEEDPMTKFQLEMTLQHTIVFDEVYLKYGVDEDQFNKAFREFQLQEHPKVKEILHEQLKMAAKMQY